ncbi:hypothetical protein ABND46_20920, partial [Paenibacillus larvae]
GMKWLTPRFLAIVMSVLTICVLFFGILIDIQRIKINLKDEAELNYLHSVVEKFERHPKVQKYLENNCSCDSKGEIKDG